MRDGLAAEPLVRSAWPYRSVARSTDAPRSDLDLALVTTDNSVDTTRQVRDVVQALGDPAGRAHLALAPHAHRSGNDSAR